MFKGSGKHNRYFGRSFALTLTPVLWCPPARCCLRCQEQLSKAAVSPEKQENAVPLQVWALPGQSPRTVPLLLLLYKAKSCGSSGRIPSRLKGMASLGRISFLPNCFLHCISILTTCSFFPSQFYAVFDTRTDKCYWRNTCTSNWGFVAKWTCRLALEAKNGMSLPCQSLWHSLWQILPNDF